MKHQHIAIIGYGAIAAYVVDALANDPALAIRYAIAREGREAAARAALGKDIEIVTCVEDLPDTVTLAVDCAGHEGLRAHGPALLHKGIDVISVSNGALADADLAITLDSAARAGGSRLRLLSGAVGAMDALSAASVGGLESVTYISRKPPLGWSGTPAEDRLDLASLTEAAVHFEGTARDAALAYPKNANVAATVALAGIGMDATKVRLIADPAMTANRHEIEAVGAFGRFRFEIEGNALPSNPKSSALTAMSIVQAIRLRTMPVSV